MTGLLQAMIGQLSYENLSSNVSNQATIATIVVCFSQGSISKWDQLSPERSHDHDHQRFSERITPELDETVKLTGAGQKRKGLPITDTDNKKTATCETVAPKGVITQKPTNSIWSQFEWKQPVCL